MHTLTINEMPRHKHDVILKDGSLHNTKERIGQALRLLKQKATKNARKGKRGKKGDNAPSITNIEFTSQNQEKKLIIHFDNNTQVTSEPLPKEWFNATNKDEALPNSPSNDLELYAAYYDATEDKIKEITFKNSDEID